MSLLRLGRPLAAADVARPRVVGDHVARLNAEILGRQRSVADPRERRCRRPRANGTTFGCASRHGVDELEARDAVVVFGPRLDGDLLERRDLLVAGRPQDPHVRRAVVHHAEEVLRVAGRAETIAIGQSDAIGVVAREHQIAFEHADRPSCAKHVPVGRRPDAGLPETPSGRTRSACRCGRARGPWCPPAHRYRRRLVPRAAASWRRPDIRSAGRSASTRGADERGHGVVRRAPRSRRDAILERSVDRLERRTESPRRPAPSRRCAAPVRPRRSGAA